MRAVNRTELIGQRFGQLTVHAFADLKNQKRTWLSVCDCGRSTIVPTGQLRSGATTSCGCVRLKRHTTHGQSKSRTYRIWLSMRARCEAPTHTAYPYYGARGIAVCPRWQAFENFLADMGEAPPGLTIDRIRNAQGYEPGNCRWATMAEQAANKTTRVEYEHAGKRRSLVEWARDLGVDRELIRGRLRRGWSFQEAIAGL